jgi:histidinol phosphatase-like enzyme (inositol monophosphatase family)
MKEYQDFALKLAAESERLILRYYQSPSLKVDLKRDRTVVTEADKRAEELMRERITREFPDDGIIGEEFGVHQGASGVTWILDPIDGTQSFVCGVPLFGTLIGVVRDDVPSVGVVNFPALRECYYATRGSGAWWRPSGAAEALAARVSGVSSPDEALFCATSVSPFDQAGCRDLFFRALEICGRYRGWGDCYGHMLVATGRAEAMIDPVMHIWDNAALFPIVTEAGGRFFDLQGAPRIDTGSGISTNAALFETFRRLLR